MNYLTSENGGPKRGPEVAPQEHNPPSLDSGPRVRVMGVPVYTVREILSSFSKTNLDP